MNSIAQTWWTDGALLPMVTAHLGRPHAEVCEGVSSEHEYVIRLRPGTGLDGMDARAMRQVVWPAGDVEFRPKGSTQFHATHCAADWLIVSLSEEAMSQMDLASSHLPPQAIRCGTAVVSALTLDIGRRLFDLARFGETADLLEFKSLGLSLVEHLLGSDVHEKCGGNEALDRRWRGLLDFIEDRLPETVSIDQMAAYCHMSPFHFSRLFKRSIGTPPYAYVRERRVVRARDEVLAGKVPLAEIAYACGFSSQSHMTATFQQVLRRTPNSFRVARRVA